MSRWKRTGPSGFIGNHNPGVYVIYAGNEPVYVGHTQDLHKRVWLGWHTTFHVDALTGAITFPFGTFGRGLYYKHRIEKRYGERAMAELRLIRRIQPKGNTMHKPKHAIHISEVIPAALKRLGVSHG